jgi:hypothetical protein
MEVDLANYVNRRVPAREFGVIPLISQDNRMNHLAGTK